MVLRLGSLLGGGLLLTVLGACSDDDSDRGDVNGGSAGSKPGGGAAGAAAQAGQSGAGGHGGSAGKGAAGSGAGARGGGAGAGGAGRGGAGTGGAQAGLGGEGGDGASGAGASGDAGQGGSGGSGEPGESRWDGCPNADDYEGDAEWPNVLEVTAGAIYCATFDESRTLKEELAQKALLRIAPGSYHLPSADVESLGLPSCIAYGEDTNGVPVTPGSITYGADETSGEVRYNYEFGASVPSPNRTLALQLNQTKPSGEAFEFELDGANDPDPFDDNRFYFVLCQSADEPCYSERVFDSCTHGTSILNRHEVTLEDGTLVLDLRLGQSAASTEPGAFVRAAGTFRGQSFEQTNYFRLIYNPEHHHFERHFAVLFDAPIDGACGLEISNFSAFDEVAPAAFTVDCELDRLDPLTVTDFSLMRVE
jgi:hypothetical protein